ncbi:HD domain-containing protein [Micromonospora sp. CPCC 206061]|uniref:HD domain-containing protein n=1 Tax=Micromonospora sp. CPCC 206061 TaxID=3122410 RepID=UPI002FF15974
MTLIDRWRTALRDAGCPSISVDGAGEALLDRWREPHRRYHAVAHLTAMLSIVESDRGSAPVRLAVWYHDAVYDPRAPGDANERASAALAERELTALGLPAPVVAEVSRLVLLTATHAAEPGDANGALLCDADLAILASPPADYDAYAAAVREEYAHVPDDAFRAGRAAILEALLSLPALYRLHTDWEELARANLARELAVLRPS